MSETNHVRCFVLNLQSHPLELLLGSETIIVGPRTEVEIAQEYADSPVLEILKRDRQVTVREIAEDSTEPLPEQTAAREHTTTAAKRRPKSKKAG